MKSNFWAAAAFVGVFALGAVAGVGGTRAYMFKEFGSPFEGPPREARSRLRIESMRRQLELTPDQVDKIRAIFRETDDDFDNATKPCRDELDSLHKRTNDRIIETLTPAQVVKFREFSEKMHKRRGRGPFPHAHPSDHMPPPPPPGP
jgi:Spy/CpxP family protein refolding chaperone